MNHKLVALYPVITKNNKYPVIIFAGIIVFTLYLLTNHYQFFPARELPAVLKEQMLPFMPWSVLVYYAMYPWAFWVFMKEHDLDRINRLGWAFIVINVITFIIFVCFPTTYPRELFTAGYDQGGIFMELMKRMWAVDTPANCFPSIHVSFSFLAAFTYANQKRWKYLAALLFASIVTLSTMTTKQHYLLDGVSGFLLAYLSCKFFFSKKIFTVALTASKNR